MSEELRQNPNAYFITLTIDDDNYTNLANICNSDNDNEIATKAIRLTCRLEEMFDAKGIETGSKMVKQTITKGSN